MIYNNEYSFIIRNSKNIFYKFTLNNQNNLLLQTYSDKGIISSSVLKESIVNFSISIDPIDKIHILYTSKQGNIKYAIYPSTSHKNINVLNIAKNFNVLFLTLKIINFNPHIFYILENKLQPSCQSIYHGFLKNDSFNIIKIEDITFSKYIYPYIVDIYNGDIYLFYAKTHNTFSIKKFNINLKNWTTYTDNIFLPAATSVIFLVNNKNTALLCYSGLFNKNIQTFIKYKELESSDSRWSDPIMLSDGTSNSTHASIINKSDTTYVTWEENGQILCRKSSYGRNDWEHQELLTHKNSKLFTGVYLSNHHTDKDFKSVLTIIDINNFPYPIINLYKNNSNSFYIDKNLKNNLLFIPLNNKLRNTNKKEAKHIEELKNIIADKEKKIIELSQNNLILKNELEIRNKQLENIKKNIPKKNWFSKFFGFY